MDNESIILFKEMLKICNEQTNQLRKMYKEKMMLEKHVEEKFYLEISRTVNDLINIRRDLEKKNIELEILNNKLNDLAVKDHLTGLYNRRYFYENIEKEIVKAKRIGYSISLIMIDLNDFKKVNDSLGHEEGDRLLKGFGNICQQLLRKDFDFVIRFGGDEFIIVLLDCIGKGALEVAMRLDHSFKEMTDITSLAYGIVEIKHDNEDMKIKNYLKMADEKMYYHKNSKR